MTEQEFRNKYVGKAVHCDTEEKAKTFLKLAHECGFKWVSGESLLSKNNWVYYTDKACYRLIKNDVIESGMITYYKSIGLGIVEFGSEGNKVKKTKKVFDLGLFVDRAVKRGKSQKETLEAIRTWALKSHGKTKEEMWKCGILTVEKWMKEVEADVELTEHEIEALNALKVLGYNWIAIDKDGDLYAYVSKPIKNSFSYGGLDHSVYLRNGLFSFITWQDEEPTSIDELLGYTN